MLVDEMVIFDPNISCIFIIVSPPGTKCITPNKIDILKIFLYEVFIFSVLFYY